MTDQLTILYQDEALLAISKPAGLLMHPSPLAPRETDTLVSRLRLHLGESRIHSIHRLDRPTSGVVLLARTPAVARQLAQSFSERRVRKLYLAIARGFTAEAFSCQEALQEELDERADRLAQRDKAAQPAHTDFQRLAIAEIGLPVSRYPKTRLSLLSCSPQTGRKHQIRRHLKKLRHPIMGDTRHGDRHHNHWAWEHSPLTTLALHAQSLQFEHPVSGHWLTITAPLPETWQRCCQWLGWQRTALRFSDPMPEVSHAGF
ncbi:MAG: tRNA pseudouridine(65) synthase TruC [Saccharospirillum sp.]|nr:tRNA pseudouridine(65) synthase TruC [Saccharospirillum sp.]